MEETKRRMGFQKVRELHLNYQSAYQFDCEMFLKKFATSKSMSYELFAEVWCTNKFGQVFCGHYNAYTLEQFTQLLFQCTKKYILYSKCKYLQVGALYLLYALYNKQPVKDCVKIRLTMEDFQIIDKLLHSLKDENHLEPIVIFKELIDANAIDFTVSEQQLSPDNKYVMDNAQIRKDMFVLTAESFLHKFERDTKDDLKDLRALDENYQKVLKSYLGDDLASLGFDRTADGVLPIPDELEAIFKATPHESQQSTSATSSETLSRTAVDMDLSESRQDILKKAYGTQFKSDFLSKRT